MQGQIENIINAGVDKISDYQQIKIFAYEQKKTIDGLLVWVKTAQELDVGVSLHYNGVLNSAAIEYNFNVDYTVSSSTKLDFHSAELWVGDVGVGHFYISGLNSYYQNVGNYFYRAVGINNTEWLKFFDVQETVSLLTNSFSLLAKLTPPLPFFYSDNLLFNAVVPYAVCKIVKTEPTAMPSGGGQFLKDDLEISVFTKDRTDFNNFYTFLIETFKNAESGLGLITPFKISTALKQSNVATIFYSRIDLSVSYFYDFDFTTTTPVKLITGAEATFTGG